RRECLSEVRPSRGRNAHRHLRTAHPTATLSDCAGWRAPATFFGAFPASTARRCASIPNRVRQLESRPGKAHLRKFRTIAPHTAGSPCQSFRHTAERGAPCIPDRVLLLVEIFQKSQSSLESAAPARPGRATASSSLLRYRRGSRGGDRHRTRR